MTRCRSCDRQYDLPLRAGMMYWPLESVIRYTRGKARHTLQDILAQHRIVSAEYGNRLFACPACDTLHERFYVRVDYEEARRHKQHTFETSFLCGACRTPLVEPVKAIDTYRCASCGSYSLDPKG